jgi:hypothetical protein
MMEIMGIELEGILLLLLGSLGGMLVGVVAAGWNKVEKIVAATENKIDDKALEIVREGVRRAIEDGQPQPPAPE